MEPSLLLSNSKEQNNFILLKEACFQNLFLLSEICYPPCGLQQGKQHNKGYIFFENPGPGPWLKQCIISAFHCRTVESGQ